MVKTSSNKKYVPVNLTGKFDGSNGFVFKDIQFENIGNCTANIGKISKKVRRNSLTQVTLLQADYTGRWRSWTFGNLIVTLFGIRVDVV